MKKLNIHIHRSFITALFVFCNIYIGAVTLHTNNSTRLVDAIINAGYSLENIYDLKVIGDINSEDVAVLQSMVKKNLRVLDLYDANYTEKKGFRLHDNDRLKSLKLMSNMKEIEDSAFYGSNLSYVLIPQTVISIGKRAFETSWSLSIDIEDVNAWCHINSKMQFAHPDGFKLWLNGKELNEVVIPEGDTKINSYPFHRCLNLTSVTLPEGIKEIGEWAFDGCCELEKINLPESVEKIDTLAFAGCEKLEAITIPNKVTKMAYSTFSGCSNLTSITLPNSVTTIDGWTFHLCTSLPSIILPNKLESIGSYCFILCKSLTSLAIPSSVDSIGNHAFCYCDNLTSIYAYGKEPAIFDGEHTHGHYDECYLTENCTLYVPKGSMEAYRSSNWGKYFSKIEEFDAETGIENVSKEIRATESDRYDTQGLRLSAPTKGINIVKFSDGSVRKEMIK